MSQIKAIETNYAGCRFRSRLEARWAVFFDCLGIRWEYEPEGFVGTYGTPYLPDFHLSVDDIYVEVKGSDEQLRADSAKIGEAIDFDATPVAKGLLILGPVPDVRSRWGTVVTHPLLTWRKGVEATRVSLESGVFGPKIIGWGPAMIPSRDIFIGNYTLEVPPAVSVEADIWSITQNGQAFEMPQRLFDAYVAARSARFEHGEAPVPRVKQPIPVRPSARPAPIDPVTGRAALGGRATTPHLAPASGYNTVAQGGNARPATT